MKQEFRVGTKEIRSSGAGTGEKKKNTRKNRRITRKSVRTQKRSKSGGFEFFAIGLTRKMNTKKGRPKKKPTYSEEMIMQELLSAISDAYLTGGNGKGETSSPAVSLRQVANEFDITLMKARKLLITAGVYHTEISEEVNELKAEGKTIEQIMELTGLKRSSVHSYLPYTKSIYNLKELSLYAERCRLYRARKKAVESLRELESDSSIEDRLWDAIRIFAGYRFTTAKSLVFRYTVFGNEIRVDRKKKSIVRSSVNMALKKVIDADGKIRGPKELGVYGASYLYPMFQRFGLIQEETKKF